MTSESMRWHFGKWICAFIAFNYEMINYGVRQRKTKKGKIGKHNHKILIHTE